MDVLDRTTAGRSDYGAGGSSERLRQVLPGTAGRAPTLSGSWPGTAVTRAAAAVVVVSPVACLVQCYVLA